MSPIDDGMDPYDLFFRMSRYVRVVTVPTLEGIVPVTPLEFRERYVTCCVAHMTPVPNTQILITRRKWSKSWKTGWFICNSTPFPTFLSNPDFLE